MTLDILGPLGLMAEEERVSTVEAGDATLLPPSIPLTDGHRIVQPSGDEFAATVYLPYL